MQKLTFFNYKIQNNDDVCDIYIDGVIVDASTKEVYKSWFEDDTPTSFKSLREQVSKNTKTVNVYINSGGGQVTEAMAIHDYLVNLQSEGVEVNTFGRGIIASAATYILMASKNSTISKNSWFMIHNVSGGVWGDVNEIENYAQTLRNFNDTVAEFYSNATSLSKTVISNMMNKETWLNGGQAKEKGFVKSIENDQTFSNSINKNQWLFNNTQVLEAYNQSTKSSLEMNIKELVMNALREAGIIKNETETKDYEAIATAVENALKPVNENLDSKIQEAVTAALDTSKESISNIVSDAVKELASKSDIQNLVNKDDIKGFITNEVMTEEIKKVSDELETVKSDIANKKSGEAGKKFENESDEEVSGIYWKGK